jgi:hypothetical protein
MKYSLTILELIDRPIIRNDRPEEWMNKMTDEEEAIWDKEARAMCIAEGTPQKFPDMNAAHLAKSIDRGILYSLIKMGEGHSTT